MKLRFPFRPQQLLFAAASALLLDCAAMAQVDADVVIAGSAQRLKVIGVTGSSLMVRSNFGDRGIPLAQIQEVRMQQPAEYVQAFQAYQAKDFAKALPLMKGVADKFKGMPASWAQQANLMLGELYIRTNDLAKAEEAYNTFKKLYPGGGSLQSEVGLSLLAVAKKDYATAKEKLEPITAAALQEKIVSPVNALAYSQAFLVSGQVKEADGKFAEALEDYLRTVTLFYHDRAAVSSAQERADALREAHKDVTAP